MTRITEQSSNYNDLEKKSIEELTALINQEDKTVPLAIEKALPAIQELIKAIVDKLRDGGRMFYLGAGSGGRLSVLDVIELPTTYGIDPGRVNAVLAGGVENLVLALEEKEDDELEGWHALQAKNISTKDIVIGISASGTTPFVLAGLRRCKENGITTGCIVSNPSSPIAEQADFPVEVITGPEFITGSTRMKCGTAQKMIFDMISTTTMIQMGRVVDNKMVHVKLINNKIIDRAVHILMELAGMKDYDEAKTLLIDQGSVDKAVRYLKENNNR
jgi:N-acetylmuramic acid 6-phosphate etherase